MNITRNLLTAAAVAATLAASNAALAAEPVPRAFGLTSDNGLVRFRIDLPKRERFIGYITGFDTDTRIVGIDFRVQDGLLYAVGDQGGIYT